MAASSFKHALPSTTHPQANTRSMHVHTPCARCSTMVSDLGAGGHASSRGPTGSSVRGSRPRIPVAGEQGLWVVLCHWECVVSGACEL